MNFPRRGYIEGIRTGLVVNDGIGIEGSVAVDSLNRNVAAGPARPSGGGTDKYGRIIWRGKAIKADPQGPAAAAGCRNGNAKLPEIGNGVRGNPLSSRLQRCPGLSTSTAKGCCIGELDRCVPSGAAGQCQFRLIERPADARGRHDDGNKKCAAYREWIGNQPIVEDLENTSARGARIQDVWPACTRGESQSPNIAVAQAITEANPACASIAAFEHAIARSGCIQSARSIWVNDESRNAGLGTNQVRQAVVDGEPACAAIGALEQALKPFAEKAFSPRIEVTRIEGINRQDADPSVPQGSVTPLLAAIAALNTPLADGRG